MNIRELYDRRIQWFEPLADNYRRPIYVNPEIISNARLRHFSWLDIASFAEVDRALIDYNNGNPGDWKVVDNGADGFILITVNGTPYWADAVGQIPFAVNYFKLNLIEQGSHNSAIQNTVKAGKDFANGLFTLESDESNTYDNYFVLRGALYAHNRYRIRTARQEEVVYERGIRVTVTKRTLAKRSYNPNLLGNPITNYERRTYGL